MNLRAGFPLAIIAIVLCSSVLGVIYFTRGPVKDQITTASAQPTIPVEGAEPPHSKGPTDAPVIIEEFGDFQCQACGKLYPLLKTIEKEYGSRIRVVFREFPLAQHRKAVLAARAAEAAGLQGRFWEMHDMLYENMSSWTSAPNMDEVFEDYAHQLGLDQERFRQDLAGLTVKNRVTLDRRRGTSMRVAATPTVFLNGTEIPYEQLKTIEALRVEIDRVLKTKM